MMGEAAAPTQIAEPAAIVGRSWIQATNALGNHVVAKWNEEEEGEKVDAGGW